MTGEPRKFVSYPFFVTCLAGSLGLLYFLPSLVETRLVAAAGPWVGAILFGNLIGCLVLARLQGFRIAAVLYAVLALSECIALLLQMPPSVVIWFSDLVPALVVAEDLYSRGVSGFLEEPETL